jgi:hypothetical protein
MGQTSLLHLPYPEETDTADVPRDVQSLAVAVEAAFGSQAMSKIADVTLAAPAAQIDFTNIPQTYAHLLLVGQLNCNISGAPTANLSARFNNDIAGNYSWQAIYTTTAVTQWTGQSGTAQPIGTVSGDGGVPYEQGACMLLVPNYTRANAGHPSIGIGASQGSTTGWMRTDLFSGFWNQNLAINRLTVFVSGQNFLTSNRATLYGLPGGP